MASLPGKEEPDPGPERSPPPGDEVEREREPVGEVGGSRGDILDAARNWRRQKKEDETRREDMGGEAEVGTGGAGRDYGSVLGVWGAITPGPGRVVAGDGASG